MRARPRCPISRRHLEKKKTWRSRVIESSSSKASAALPCGLTQRDLLVLAVDPTPGADGREGCLRVGDRSLERGRGRGARASKPSQRPHCYLISVFFWREQGEVLRYGSSGRLPSRGGVNAPAFVDRIAGTGADHSHMDGWIQELDRQTGSALPPATIAGRVSFPQCLSPMLS